jgi:hypothetical protein
MKVINELMINISQTDPHKETVSYLKALNLASALLKTKLKDMTLAELHDEFLQKDLKIPLPILSQVKNKSLPHQYPNTIKHILIFFGYENILISKKVLLTFDKPQKKQKQGPEKLDKASNSKSQKVNQKVKSHANSKKRAPRNKGDQS